MNEKNKLTNGSQSNQNENNYLNSNSSNYNNSENNSSNQYYFEEENYNNNKNFENYNYNNQEQYYNNNYDSNYPNNANYNGNNEQNPYYNNSYNQNMDGNNTYNNQEQYPNYYNNFDENNEQIFYNNQEQFPNYNNDFNGNNEQNFYNNQEQFLNYNNDFNGNSEQVFYNNQEQFPDYNNDFNGNNEQNFYINQEQFPNYNNDFNGNSEQVFYNNKDQYSNVEQNNSASYPSTNSTLTDVPQEETHTSSNNNFESMNTQQQETQNTQDILMARELQKAQESEESQEDQDNQETSDDDKPRKSKLGIIITSIIGLIILLSAGGYFAYNHINKNKEIAVNMSQYELEFTTSGTEGEGKPSANIKNIPNVDNASDDLKQLLQNPKISYDKNDNLRNGDKVEVSLSLDKSELNGKKIVIKDEFKRSFTVRGLKEKEKDRDKETTETKENSNNDSNSSSSDKSTSKTNSRVKEDSSVDTTKLSEEQVKNWVLASYIQLLPDMTKDDYIVSVSLHSDNLVYAVISENPNSSKHPSPKMLPTRYRINAKGELEASSRMTEDWRVISKAYMYVE